MVSNLISIHYTTSVYYRCNEMHYAMSLILSYHHLWCADTSA